jgi:hypothetical protein
MKERTEIQANSRYGFAGRDLRRVGTTDEQETRNLNTDRLSCQMDVTFCCFSRQDQEIYTALLEETAGETLP